MKSKAHTGRRKGNGTLPGIPPSQYEHIYGFRNEVIPEYPEVAEVETPIINHIPVRPQECLTYLKNLMTGNIPEKITFTSEAWIKMNCYVQLVGKLEIAGFGKIENGVVTDIAILPNQIVKSSHAEADAVAVASFMASVPRKELHKWVLDWHSHANISMVQPSKTDMDNYEEINDLRDKEGFPYLIINRAGNISAGFFLGNGHTTKLTIEIPAKLDRNMFEPIYNKCKEEVAANCVEEKVTYKKAVVNRKEVAKQTGFQLPIESCIVNRK